MLTDEEMLSAIAEVCDFDRVGVERWRREALIIGRAVERATLASAPAQQWISVDERLPERYAWVIAHNGKWTGVATYIPDLDTSAERWQDERAEFVELLGPKVTHWMPLPCAPAAEA